jgi:hypothetical protein
MPAMNELLKIRSGFNHRAIFIKQNPIIALMDEHFHGSAG